ncbi:unnamed protein product [Bursaphelenchus xylophilus]|uniref:(pine wood nematode) hypothetical protein n=1 Tax=Bursaphelenchus xylophilus TaxID=6326 RepID=A0A1I7RXG1_BURXY|nr:unnamed protein product [Bursaphelenchus xylophilus]CAG9126383.1 unnamed protein product [Bursaphelenchus xylophilus]
MEEETEALLYEDWIAKYDATGSERKKRKEQFVKEFLDRSKKAKIGPIIEAVAHPPPPAPKPVVIPAREPSPILERNDVFHELLEKNIELQKQNEAIKQKMEGLQARLDAYLRGSPLLTAISDYEGAKQDQKVDVQHAVVSLLSLAAPNLKGRQIFPVLKDILLNFQGANHFVEQGTSTEERPAIARRERQARSDLANRVADFLEQPIPPKYLRRAKEEMNLDEYRESLEDLDEEELEKEEEKNRRADDELAERLRELTRKIKEADTKEKKAAVQRPSSEAMRQRYISRIQRLPDTIKSSVNRPAATATLNESRYCFPPKKAGFDNRLTALSSTLNARMSTRTKIKQEQDEEL